MYDCPQCGANLRYDIEKGAMFCDHCGHTQDPYSYEKERDAEVGDNFGVTVFICPQCGGEIMTTDVTAAAFCSYCGASTILDSRLKEEKRPAHIIPFKKTKEDCCKAYKRFTSRALYTPGALRDPEYLQRFRGIYMPYWVYRFDYDSHPSLEGTKSYRRRNYIYTDHYSLNCDLQAVYDGITYDASSSFDDAISLSISPFPADQLQPFTPAFLSGFYADSPDVDANEYRDFAKAECNTDAVRRLLAQPDFKGYDVKEYGTNLATDRALGTHTADPRCAFLPVWFLTYRKNDRVAYAVMNGVTGRMTADLPVDEKKFMLGGLILAIPLFLLLNMFLTLTAKTTLTVAAFAAAFVLWIYLMEIGAISRKETREMDLGYLSKLHKDGGKSSGPQTVGQYKKQAADSMKGRIKPVSRSRKTLGGILSVLFALFFIVSCAYYLFGEAAALTGGIHRLLGIVVFLVSALLEVMILPDKSERTESADRNNVLHTIGAAAGVLAACFILIFNPASDLYYYAATIVCFVGILMTILGIISKYNVLATRPIPNFTDREGGDDKPVRGYSLSGILPWIIVIPAAVSLLAGQSSLIRAAAADPEEVYRNAETGYIVYISDREDLLTDNEEALLAETMQAVTDYGNALFVTDAVTSGSAENAARSDYYSRYGNESGCIFLIDMNHRVLTLQSTGEIYRTVTRGYANTITDNVYRYASRGDYYGCAAKAFEQVAALMEGSRIAQPMKYICNALMALILALLFNYSFLRLQMRHRRPSHAQIMGAAKIAFAASNSDARFMRQTKVYDPPARSSGGGGGSRGGGGGGGGFSGGGGSHGF